MGRNAVAGAPRTARIDLCLTDAEKKALEDKARSQGLTVGQLVRRDVLGVEVTK